MTDRPILFTGPMVRAILDGRKTVTRRLVTGHDVIEERDDGTPWPYYTTWSHGDDGSPWQACPYGVPGDRLWVRETWRYHDWTNDGLPWIAYAADGCHRLCESIPDEWSDRVEDVWATLSDQKNTAIDGVARDRRWRPSIFLPRWASRLTLDVVRVQVERLQAITEEDANREGVEYMDGLLDESDLCRVAKEMGAMATDSRVWFACLWDRLNASRAPWDSDPWVWRVEFRRVVTP